jgi:nicotinate-nucleotide pyrophosphorylase (carboxylating)
VQKISQKYIKTIAKQALQEDLRPSGDITTRIIKNKKVTAKIIAGQNCIVGGLSFAKEAFKISDKKITFKAKTKDGRKINRGKVIAILKGNASGILKSERVALNFLGLISGVATTTNRFVKKVKGKSCKICCTRKTLPNLRLIQKYGVKLGGGINHRFNLSDEILIKDNHISVDQNIRELVKRAIKNKKGKKITVEVDNLNQLKKIICLKFNRVLFDNMSPKNLRKGVRMSKRFYETEASGGVTLKNVRKIAGTGVKRISIGQITHSAPSINFKLDFIS